MENNILDNSFPLESKKSLTLIKSFFEAELPDFKLTSVDDGDKYNGFNIKYESSNTQVKFTNPRGGLDYDLFIDGKQYSLAKYDERMKEVYVCSEKNLKFTLSILKKFITKKI